MSDFFNPSIFLNEIKKTGTLSEPESLSGSHPIKIQKEQLNKNQDTTDFSQLLETSGSGIVNPTKLKTESPVSQIVSVLTDIKQLVQEIVNNNLNTNSYDGNIEDVLSKFLEQSQLVFDFQTSNLDFIRQENIKDANFLKRQVRLLYLTKFWEFSKFYDARKMALLSNVDKTSKKYNLSIGSINAYTQTSNQIISKNINAPPEVLSVLFLSSIHELLRHFALDSLAHSKGISQGKFIKELYQNLDLGIVQELGVVVSNFAHSIPILKQTVALGYVLARTISGTMSGIKTIFDFISGKTKKEKLIDKYSSKKTPEMRMADAITKLPSLLESSRITLVSIEEILQNSFIQDNQLLQYLTGSKYKYTQTQDKNERIYVEELGQFLTYDENIDYKSKKRKLIEHDVRFRFNKNKLANDIYNQSEINNKYITNDVNSELLNNDFRLTGKMDDFRNNTLAINTVPAIEPSNKEDIKLLTEIKDKLHDNTSSNELIDLSDKTIKKLERIRVYTSGGFKLANIKLETINNTLSTNFSLLNNIISTIGLNIVSALRQQHPAGFAKGGLRPANILSKVGEEGKELSVPSLTPTIVGTKGPELTVPKQDATIIPAQLTKTILDSGSLSITQGIDNSELKRVILDSILKKEKDIDYKDLIKQGINKSIIKDLALKDSKESFFNQSKLALNESSIGIKAANDNYLTTQERLDANKIKIKPAVPSTALKLPKKELLPKKETEKGWLSKVMDFVQESAVAIGMVSFLMPIIAPVLRTVVDTLFGPEFLEKVKKYTPDFISNIFNGEDGFMKRIGKLFLIGIGTVIAGPIILSAIALSASQLLSGIITGTFGALWKFALKPLFTEGLVGILGKIGIFSKIGSFIPGIFKVVLPRLLGGIFGFAIDGILGGIEGYKKGGIGGMLKGIISGIFTSSSMPANMMKYGIAGLMFGGPIGAIIGIFAGGAIQYIVDNFDSITTSASEVFKELNDAYHKYIITPIVDLFTKIQESIALSIADIPVIGKHLVSDETLTIKKKSDREKLVEKQKQYQTDSDAAQLAAQEAREKAGPGSVIGAVTEGWDSIQRHSKAYQLEKDAKDRKDRLEDVTNRITTLDAELDSLNKSQIEGKRLFGGPVLPDKWYSAGESGLEYFIDKSGKTIKLIGDKGNELFKSKLEGDIYPVSFIEESKDLTRIALNNNAASANAYLNSSLNETNKDITKTTDSTNNQSKTIREQYLASNTPDTKLSVSDLNLPLFKEIQDKAANVVHKVTELIPPGLSDKLKFDTGDGRNRDVSEIIGESINKALFIPNDTVPNLLKTFKLPILSTNTSSTTPTQLPITFAQSPITSTSTPTPTSTPTSTPTTQSTFSFIADMMKEGILPALLNKKESSEPSEDKSSEDKSSEDKSLFGDGLFSGKGFKAPTYDDIQNKVTSFMHKVTELIPKDLPDKLKFDTGDGRQRDVSEIIGESVNKAIFVPTDVSPNAILQNYTQTPFAQKAIADHETYKSERAALLKEQTDAILNAPPGPGGVLNPAQIIQRNRIATQSNTPESTPITTSTPAPVSTTVSIPTTTTVPTSPPTIIIPPSPSISKEDTAKLFASMSGPSTPSDAPNITIAPQEESSAIPPFQKNMIVVVNDIRTILIRTYDLLRSYKNTCCMGNGIGGVGVNGAGSVSNNNPAAHMFDGLIGGLSSGGTGGTGVSGLSLTGLSGNASRLFGGSAGLGGGPITGLSGPNAGASGISIPGSKMGFSQSGGFKENAAPLMNNLMTDYGLTKDQAAGIVGNLSHESSGLTAGIEQKGGGGLGWAQWTGSRRKSFESWAAQNNMNINDPAANYGFLKHELATDPSYKNTIDKVKQTTTTEEATRVWHDSYEKSADIKNGVIVKPTQYQSRLDYANKALGLDLGTNPSTQFAGQPGAIDPTTGQPQIAGQPGAPYSIDQYQQELGTTRISSEYGMRHHPKDGAYKMHSGIDMAGREGTPIKIPSSMPEGTVVSAGKRGGYGNQVVVKHSDGTTSSYNHLASIDVESGQTVNSSTTLGGLGSTGKSTGPHLHMEIKDSSGQRVNPATYLSGTSKPITGTDTIPVQTNEANKELIDSPKPTGTDTIPVQNIETNEEKSRLTGIDPNFDIQAVDLSKDPKFVSNQIGSDSMDPSERSAVSINRKNNAAVTKQEATTVTQQKSTATKQPTAIQQPQNPQALVEGGMQSLFANARSPQYSSPNINNNTGVVGGMPSSNYGRSYPMVQAPNMPFMGQLNSMAYSNVMGPMQGAIYNKMPSLNFGRNTNPLMANLLSPALNTTNNVLRGAVGNIANPLLGGVGNIIGSVTNPIMGGVSSALGGVFGGINQGLSNIVSPIFGGINSGTGAIGQGVGNALGSVGQGVRSITSPIGQGISSVGQGAGNIFAGSGQAIGSTIGAPIGQGINNAGIAIGSSISAPFSANYGGTQPSVMPNTEQFNSQQIGLNPPQTQFNIQDTTSSTIQNNAQTEITRSSMAAESIGSALGSTNSQVGASSVPPETLFSPRHNAPQSISGASGSSKTDMNMVPVDPLGDDIAMKLFSLLVPSFFNAAKSQAMDTKLNNYIDNFV